jgi:hypothetical protein
VPGEHIPRQGELVRNAHATLLATTLISTFSVRQAQGRQEARNNCARRSRNDKSSGSPMAQ